MTSNPTIHVGDDPQTVPSEHVQAHSKGKRKDNAQEHYTVVVPGIAAVGEPTTVGEGVEVQFEQPGKGAAFRLPVPVTGKVFEDVDAMTLYNLRCSIAHDGFNAPVIYDAENGLIAAGRQRIRAMRSLQYTWGVLYLDRNGTWQRDPSKLPAEFQWLAQEDRARGQFYLEADALTAWRQAYRTNLVERNKPDSATLGRVIEGFYKDAVALSKRMKDDDAARVAAEALGLRDPYKADEEDDLSSDTALDRHAKNRTASFEAMLAHALNVEPGTVSKHLSAFKTGRRQYVIQALRHENGKAKKGRKQIDVAAELGVSRNFVSQVLSKFDNGTYDYEGNKVPSQPQGKKEKPSQDPGNKSQDDGQREKRSANKQTGDKPATEDPGPKTEGEVDQDQEKPIGQSPQEAQEWERTIGACLAVPEFDGQDLAHRCKRSEMAEAIIASMGDGGPEKLRAVADQLHAFADAWESEDGDQEAA
jgi:hypothetical protein